MAAIFRAEIIAADHVVWEGEVTQLTATTTEGKIGILAGHIPLVATLAPGRAEATKPDGERQTIAVEGGLICVTGTRAVIITPYAQLA